MSTVDLIIANQNELIYSGKVSYVGLHTDDGEIGVYPKHAPLITLLVPGAVHIRYHDNKEDIFYVSGGIAEIISDKISLLVDIAVRSEKLELAYIEKAKEEASQKLKEYKIGTKDYSDSLGDYKVAVAKNRVINLIKEKNK